MKTELRNLFKLIEKQERLKNESLNLIASENIQSLWARRLQSSPLENRYIMNDFPNNQYLFEIHEKTRELLCKIFNAKYVNMSPLSGMNCMQLLLFSLCKQNDSIYTLDPINGGHASTKKMCDLHGINVEFLPFDDSQLIIDCTATLEEFSKKRPKIIYIDSAIITFLSNIEELVKIAGEFDAPVIYDASHILGLIAGNSLPNPLSKGVDFLNGSTHKTFFGPQKGIILSNNSILFQKVDTVSKDFVSSIHTGSLLALYVAALEIEKFGKQYATQVLINAKALGNALADKNIKVQNGNLGFTSTHQIWIDPEPYSAWEAYERLAKCNINVNPIRIPSLKRDGLRLGVAEVTRRGMKESEMRIIANLISISLTKSMPASKIRKIVQNLAQEHNTLAYSIDGIMENLIMH